MIGSPRARAVALGAAALAALLSACTSTATRATAGSPTSPGVGASHAPHVHEVKVAGLSGPLVLPDGFDVAITKQISARRAQYLTVVGDSVYWLADGRQTSPDQRMQYRRVERFDTRTGRVTTFATSGGAVFDGSAAGRDGLIVATETPVPSSECHGQRECMRPALELLQPDHPPRVLATSDPEILGSGPDGYLLVQVTQGALWKIVHRGDVHLQLWQSATDPVVDLGDQLPAIFTVTVAGDALVAQLWGDRRIWTTSKTPLPSAIHSDAWQPEGSPTHLAWIVSSASNSGTGAVRVSTLHDGRYTDPVPILTAGPIGNLDWLDDCSLLMEGRAESTGDATGLFITDVCTRGAPVERLLTAGQAAQRDVPARWGLAPGTLALAFDTGKTETLVVLHTRRDRQ